MLKKVFINIRKSKKPTAAKTKTAWQDLPNMKVQLSANRTRRTVAVSEGMVAPPPTNKATHPHVITID